MASYKIVPLRSNERIDRKIIERRIDQHSALEAPDPREVEEAEPRRGTLPYTLQSFGQGIHFFEYGYQKEETTTDLEGDERQYISDVRRQVVFLGNGYIAVDARCTKESLNSILELMSSILKTDVILEPVGFDDGTLREVINRAKRVEQADFDPEIAGMPDKVSGEHRSGLTKTQLWAEIRGEPIEKVRVNLPERRVKKEVGFKNKESSSNGVITIYGQNIAPELCSGILRHITDEVVSNLDVSSFQQKLGGVGS